MNLVPQWIQWTELVVLLAAIVTVLNSALRLAQELPEKYYWSHLTVYSLASFVVLLNIIDGGPLDSDSLVAIPIVYVFLTEKHTENHWELKHLLDRLARAQIFVFCCAAPFLAMALPLGSYVFQRHFFSALGTLCATAFLGILAFAAASWSRLALYLSLPLLFVLLSVGRNSKWWPNFAELMYLVPAGTTVIFGDYRGSLEGPYRVRHQEGKLRILEYTLEKPQRLWQLQEKFKLRPQEGNVYLRRASCNEGRKQAISGSLRVIEGALTNPKPTSTLFSTFELTPCEDTALCDYTFIAEKELCSPNPANTLVVNHLDRMGFRTFVITGDDFDDTRVAYRHFLQVEQLENPVEPCTNGTEAASTSDSAHVQKSPPEANVVDLDQ